MFQHLGDFKFTRSAPQAIGFYITYLILVMVVSGLLAGVGSIFLSQENSNFEEGYNMGMKVGSVIGVIFSVALTFAVLKAKELLGNFGFIWLAVLSGFLALIGGAALGLIPAAYLTTRGEKSAPIVPSVTA